MLAVVLISALFSFVGQIASSRSLVHKTLYISEPCIYLRHFVLASSPRISSKQITVTEIESVDAEN